MFAWFVFMGASWCDLFYINIPIVDFMAQVDFLIRLRRIFRGTAKKIWIAVSCH